jgi:hypothetical protein
MHSVQVSRKLYAAPGKAVQWGRGAGVHLPHLLLSRVLHG